MPRPPITPCGGVWGMGARLWISRIVKKCRSLGAAIFVVGLWLCLITVINLGFNNHPSNVQLQDDTRLFLRSGSVAGYSALALSPVEKQTETSSSLKSEAEVFLRNELKVSMPGFHSVMKGNSDRQKVNLMEDGIISGRRIQELKFSQMGGLEVLSRRYEGDQEDVDTRPSGGSSIFLSAERERIDTKAITMMEIRPDIQTSAKNLGDLQPNWTPEAEERASYFSSHGIPKHEQSQKEQESILGSAVASHDKTSVSESDSNDHKTSSEAPKMPTAIVKDGLQAQKKSISGHLPQSISEMHNRQSNFYDGSSSTINRHFNSDERPRAREREVSVDPDNSGPYSIQNSDHYLQDPSVNSDSTTNTQFQRATRPKSNLESSVAMQMNVPKRNKEFWPHSSIDQTGEPSTFQMNPGVKYPAHLSTLHQDPDKSNRNRNEPEFMHSSRTINRSPVQTRNGSSLTPSANKLSRDNSQDGKTTGENVRDVENQGLETVEGNSEKSQSIEKTEKLLMAKDTNARLNSTIKLMQQEILKYDGFELYSYNTTRSNSLPLNRKIPDTRPEGCRDLPVYSDKSLPGVTVIVCFHNEALSVLLRTLYSVIDRTPAHLLEKIILVDDYSTMDDLALPLEKQLIHLRKVALTRTSKREGLVRARLLGSSLATSSVLVFLDAHCECNEGWLEPLLDSLVTHPNKVVSPYIDTIKAENFQYKQSPPQLQGGFNWRLEFGWRAALRSKGLPKETEPILTPVISGGLFAVRREYFNSMGGYDSQLNIWGGENFEMSFKTWMCGGSMEIVPCSRVGHVFRASLPYTFTGDREETVLRNLARVAHVWMDEYADIFYAAVNLPNDLDIGDTSERVQLRQDLGCQSFKWYLDHVFPQMEIVSPNTIVYGQVRSKGSLMCLDVMKSTTGYYLGLSACQGGKNQTLRLTSDSRLMQGDACIVPGLNKQLTLSLCNSDVKWVYKNGQVLLNHTNLCMTSVDNEIVYLLPCDKDFTTTVVLSNQEHKHKDVDDVDHNYKTTSSSASNIFQTWTFDYSFNWKRRRRRRKG